MSVKIVITAPGINLSASLKNEALSELIQLSQKFRDDTEVPVQTAAGGEKYANIAPTGNSEEAIKSHLKNYAAAELLNHLRWDSYPEKILLLGAWFEAKGGTVPWKSADIDEVFKQAKEKPPGNFPRDIKQAIKAAWIGPMTARTYCVTRTGWNKLAEAFNA